ncbi:MAG: glycine zipper 2TM domain-containing protein [Polaromonas sp.]
MKHAFVKTLAASAMGAAGLTCLPASAMDILARVISSTPVVQQVAVPRQVCNNQQVLTQAPRSGAGALVGALAGGVVGNAIGSGGGRAAATMIGAVGGAMVGDNLERPGAQLQNVQQCTTQTFYENRASHYNVVYEYQGAQYTAQMANDPGGYVRLQVTPVGGMTSQESAYPAYPPQPVYQSAPAPQQQTYYPPPVVQQPVYVQPAAYAAPYPAYYPQPYYAPFVAPIGLSLNFGYSRGFGGYRHGR